MSRLSWNPAALAPSAMLPPFREPASLAVLWNGVTYLRDVGAERRRALGGRRILYGHRAGGSGVAAGVQAVVAESPVAGLRVIRTARPYGIGGPALMTVDVGADGDPCDCLRAFGALAAQTVPSVGIDEGLALFELSCSDIDEMTDADQLFEEYRSTLSKLASQYPSVDFIPVTVPLAGEAEPTINRMIRRSLGRDTDFKANRHRNRFNRRLLDEYAGRNAVFDLARLQSTRPDGTRAFDYEGGEVVYCLAPEYAGDTVRLTDAAQRMLGEQLLVFLAGLPLPSRALVGTGRAMALK